MIHHEEDIIIIIIIIRLKSSIKYYKPRLLMEIYVSHYGKVPVEVPHLWHDSRRIDSPRH